MAVKEQSAFSLLSSFHAHCVQERRITTNNNNKKFCNIKILRLKENKHGAISLKI